MKYVSLKDNKTKHLNIPVINKGLNLCDGKDKIEKQYLADCKNVYYADGLLKRRKGFYADSSDIIKADYITDDTFQNCVLTNAEVMIDGKKYRVLIDDADVDMSTHYTSIFFIDDDKQLLFGGCLEFHRISDEFFYLPSNITVFQSGKKNGAGIYAFVTCSNTYDFEDKTYNIYEINSDYNAWEEVTSYYIPVAYVNGRGDSYDNAVDSKQVYTGEPHLLEPLNLLHGTFLAYFSSDGLSSRFALPFSKLTDERVSCRIYYNETEYMEWHAFAGSVTAKKKFLGVDVTMNVDRNKGEIYFTVEAGDYSVPLMSKYKANNIRITATKRNDSDFSSIVSSTCCSIVNSCLVFSGGNKKNKVFTAVYDKPLYFPFDGEIQIGDASDRVTAMAIQSDSIVAFKKNGIYRIKAKRGKLKDAKAILGEVSRTYYENNDVSITAISRKNGCLNSNAITYKDGNIVWIDTDKQIYKLTNSFNVERITNKISSYLQNLDNDLFEECSTVAGNDGIYICLGEKIVFGQFNSDENIAWYIWELPKDMRVLGGIENKSPIFLCDYNYTTYYLAVLSGETDSVLSRISDETPKNSYKIPSFIETSHLAPEGMNIDKRLSKIDLLFGMSGDGAVSINGKKVDFSGASLGTEAKRITVLPEIKTFRTVYIMFESSENLAVGEIDIYYNRFT